MEKDEFIEFDDKKPIEQLATDEFESIVIRTGTTLQSYERDLAEGVGGEAGRPILERVIRGLGDIHLAQKQLLDRQRQQDRG